MVLKQVSMAWRLVQQMWSLGWTCHRYQLTPRRPQNRTPLSGSGEAIASAPGGSLCLCPDRQTLSRAWRRPNTVGERTVYSDKDQARNSD